VLQFITVIGVYLFAMAIGLWLSRYVEQPILKRPFSQRYALKGPVSQVLTFDYLGALSKSLVRVVNADAYAWLESNAEFFDVIVVDFPDPTNSAIGKLYSTSFYQRAEQRLTAGGFMVVQTTSPLIARKSFRTAVTTLEAVGLRATPYHAHVPGFGEWGFVIAGRRLWSPPAVLPAGLRCLTLEGVPARLQSPPDMARVPAEVNRLSNQGLVSTFEKEWGRVSR